MKDLKSVEEPMRALKEHILFTVEDLESLDAEARHNAYINLKNTKATILNDRRMTAIWLQISSAFCSTLKDCAEKLHKVQALCQFSELQTETLKGLIKQNQIKDFLKVLEDAGITEENECQLNKKQACVILALSEGLLKYPIYLENKKDFTKTQIYTRLAKFFNITANNPKKKTLGYKEKLGDIENFLKYQVRFK